MEFYNFHFETEKGGPKYTVLKSINKYIYYSFKSLQAVFYYEISR